MGAEPESIDSIADKLACRYKPFSFLDDNDVRAVRSFNRTAGDSGKATIDDAHIRAAYRLLRSKGIDTEPSAAAGLALYMERYKQGLVRDDARIVVVNTGSGL
jgi:threonine synthase